MFFLLDDRLLFFVADKLRVFCFLFVVLSNTPVIINNPKGRLKIFSDYFKKLASVSL